MSSVAGETDLASSSFLDRPGRWAGRLADSALLVGDAVALCAALVVVDPTLLPCLLALVIVTDQWFAGAYRFRLNLGGLRDAPHVLTRAAVPALVLAPVALGTGQTDLLFGFAAVAGLLLVLARTVLAQVLGVLRRQGRLLQPAVILGCGVVARALAQRLSDHGELGLRVVGHVDEDEDPEMPAPWLGRIADAHRVIQQTGARHVVAAFSRAREESMVEVLRVARSGDVVVHVVPRFFELGAGQQGHASEEVWGIPLHRLPPPGERAVGRHVKRLFDIVASAILLVLFAPLLVGLAIAVKLSSPGPVLFRQWRVGQHGRDFELLKFRSMDVNQDSDTTWSVHGDARVTRVGHLLRDKSLDELPQLLNVLRGDMSLVGPRPERRQFATEFARAIDRYDDRHRVPVGMTGWAQIHGLRGDTSIADRAQFDNNYIENWSLWSDLSILARTVGVVVRGRQP